MNILRVQLEIFFNGSGSHLRREVRTVFTALCLVSIAGGAYAQVDGAAWLKRIDDVERVPHSYAVIKQTINTSTGGLRTFTMRSWTDEAGDVALIVYDAPARVRGDKILQRDGGDNIWYYMARQDVQRHFTGHARRQSAHGSDFSYEDLAQGSMVDDYHVESVKFEELDDEKCVRLRLVPVAGGPSYDHLLLWACIDDTLTRRIEYYDKEGLLKTLYITDFKVIEGRKTATRMEMKNQRASSRTVMEFISITFAKKPPAWIFTKEALLRDIE